jgi:RNA polymerase sigma-70 factor (ECF subfamily)
MDAADKCSSDRPASGEMRSRDQLLDRLYRKEAPRMARALRGRLAGRDDPMDIVQEAFTRFLSSSRWMTLARPEAYLQRILRNLLIDRARRLSARTVHVPLEESREPQINAEQDLGIEAEDLHRRYRQAVDRLPPRTKQVFLLHRAEEVSYKDIAARLEITVQTVAWHIASALVHIDTTLRDE